MIKYITLSKPQICIHHYLHKCENDGILSKKTADLKIWKEVQIYINKPPFSAKLCLILSPSGRKCYWHQYVFVWVIDKYTKRFPVYLSMVWVRSSCIQISTSPEFCGSYVCREAKGNVMMTSAAFVFNQVDVHLYLKFRTQIVILKEHTVYTTGRILIFHCIVFHKIVCASVSVSVCRCGFRILPGVGSFWGQKQSTK